MVRSTAARLAVTAALGVSIAWSGMPATLAQADTASELQAQLDQANARLDSLYSEANTVSEQVNQTQEDLDATNAEIEQKQQELASAQETLSGRVSANYKTGGVSIMSILFESDSFDQMVNRIFYANKVSEADAEAIQQVKDIQTDLATKQAEQQKLLSDQKTQQAELSAKVSEAESYVNSLDSQVQEELAREQAEREAEQQRLQAEAEQQASQAGGYVDADSVTEPEVNDSTSNSGNAGSANNGGSSSNNGGSSSNGGSSNSGNNGGSSSNSGSSSSNSGSNSSSSSGLTASQRNAIVAAAWSKVGLPYVYGATGPNAYDCSGFVQYCYRQAGISLPRTAESQGGWGRSTSSPQAGDIVCWGSHVGIYIGGGKMIDAGNPSVGISYRAIYGSPWYRTK